MSSLSTQRLVETSKYDADKLFGLGNPMLEKLLAAQKTTNVLTDSASFDPMAAGKGGKPKQSGVRGMPTSGTGTGSVGPAGGMQTALPSVNYGTDTAAAPTPTAEAPTVAPTAAVPTTEEEPKKLAHGGMVSGKKGVDKVPAMLTHGEAVLPVKTVNALGGAKAVERLIAETNGKKPGGVWKEVKGLSAQKRLHAAKGELVTKDVIARAAAEMAAMEEDVARRNAALAGGSRPSGNVPTNAALEAEWNALQAQIGNVRPETRPSGSGSLIATDDEWNARKAALENQARANARVEPHGTGPLRPPPVGDVGPHPNQPHGTGPLRPPPVGDMGPHPNQPHGTGPLRPPPAGATGPRYPGGKLMQLMFGEGAPIVRDAAKGAADLVKKVPVSVPGVGTAVTLGADVLSHRNIYGDKDTSFADKALLGVYDAARAGTVGLGMRAGSGFGPVGQIVGGLAGAGVNHGFDKLSGLLSKDGSTASEQIEGYSNALSRDKAATELNALISKRDPATIAKFREVTKTIPLAPGNEEHILRAMRSGGKAAATEAQKRAAGAGGKKEEAPIDYAAGSKAMAKRMGLKDVKLATSEYGDEGGVVIGVDPKTGLRTMVADGRGAPQKREYERMARVTEEEKKGRELLDSIMANRYGDEDAMERIAEREDRAAAVAAARARGGAGNGRNTNIDNVQKFLKDRFQKSIFDKDKNEKVIEDVAGRRAYENLVLAAARNDNRDPDSYEIDDHQALLKDFEPTNAIRERVNAQILADGGKQANLSELPRILGYKGEKVGLGKVIGGKNTHVTLGDWWDNLNNDRGMVDVETPDGVVSVPVSSLTGGASNPDGAILTRIQELINRGR